MKLISLLPDYYENNITMNELQDILSDATEEAERGLSSAIDQCFICSADSLLERYEKAFGTEAGNLTTEERREQLIAKLAGSGTTTVQMIKGTARVYSNGEVEVTEDNPNYKFVIKFTGTIGLPTNMDGLKATIEEIKPAHLAVEYVYVYNTWAQAAALTWEQAAGRTWKQLREVAIS